MKKNIEELLNEYVMEKQLVNTNTLYVQTLEEDFVRIMAYHILESNDINSVYFKGNRIFSFPVEKKENYDIELNQNYIAIFEVKANGSEIDKHLLRLYDTFNRKLIDFNKEHYYEVLTNPKQKTIGSIK